MGSRPTRWKRIALRKPSQWTNLGERGATREGRLLLLICRSPLSPLGYQETAAAQEVWEVWEV